MFWSRRSLRTVLLSALLILGGWGFLSSLQRIDTSWRDYKESRELAEWSSHAQQIMLMGQHMAYERGRSAVVLRSANSISAQDRMFINEKRAQGDAAMAGLLAHANNLPNVDFTLLQAHWQTVNNLREQVDHDASLPLAARDPKLAQQWLDAATQYLMQCTKLARELISYFRAGEGATRLSLLAAFTLDLRLISGAENHLIAIGLAAKEVPDHQTILNLYDMRGRQAVLWQDIERLVGYVTNSRLKQEVEKVKHYQFEVLRPLQDQVIAAWMSKRVVNAGLMELVLVSRPTFDGISELMNSTTKEAIRLAEEGMQRALFSLFSHLFWALSVLLVMALAIYYVLAKVVRPLEEVDINLRRLNTWEEEASFEKGNQIARIKASTQALDLALQDRKRLEEELREMAFQDVLTGLPNRRLLLDRIHQAQLHSVRWGGYFAVIMLDMNKFKQLNDTHGHEKGDLLLVMVANRLRSLIREEDTVARLGGDEFVILLEGLGKDAPQAQVFADTIVEKISRSLAEEYVLGDLTYQCSASLGVKLSLGGDEGIDLILKQVDEAMYLSKKQSDNATLSASESLN